MNTADSGPLAGIRVVELAGMGPGPHAAMQLADLGAEVIRVERPGRAAAGDVLLRNRSRVCLDLAIPAAVETVLQLVEQADVLIEGFRPGVTERLGLGPQVCHARNPKLVYGRVTGWGQSGPLAQRAGHDINYIALTGALHAMGPADQPPPPPLNLVADFGGGSMLLLLGVLAALLEREHSGSGQVVDAAMVDGVGMLSQMMWSFRGQGDWSEDRGSNLLDGGAPYYRTYPCADGKYVAVGAIEPEFYRQLLVGLELVEADLPGRRDRDNWPALAERLAGAFSRRSRDEWSAIFADTDACVTPVLTFAEAAVHPHAVARQGYAAIDGVLQAMPAPRFPDRATRPVIPPAEQVVEPAAVLARWQQSAARTPCSRG